MFVACQPEVPNSVALLAGTGAATHVAGALWRTRLKILPGVGSSFRAVGGGVYPSLRQGALLIDFAEATGALPKNLELFDPGAMGFSVAAIATACADHAECPPGPDPYAAPVEVNLVTGADPPPTSPASGKTPRRCKRRLIPLAPRTSQGQGAAHLALPSTTQPRGRRRTPGLHQPRRPLPLSDLSDGRQQLRRTSCPNSAVADEYANLVEPPITVIRCPLDTQSLSLAECFSCSAT